MPLLAQLCSLRIDDFSGSHVAIGSAQSWSTSKVTVWWISSPPRQRETVARWMRTQPDLAVVSRDRGGEYASAVREGPPQAVQCADRFHVVKNLTEAVQVLLARCQAEILTEKKPDESCQDKQNKPIISIEEWRPKIPAHVERMQRARRVSALGTL